MSTPTSRDRAASRAEARRRARLANRGELAEEPTDEERDDDERPGPGGGFLRRIFPPAPPLPDKPDPLRGFDRRGSMAPVRERGFLLRGNLIAWVLPGIVSFLGLYASFFYAQSLIGMVATFVQFGALIAAGWFGWQRPTLYGTAAGILGGSLTAGLVLFDFARLGLLDTTGGPSAIISQTFLTIVWQAGFGFLGGWYGGYLRRRQAQVNRDLRSRR